MSNYDDRTFMEKYGIAVLVVVIVLIAAGVGVGFYFFSGKIPPPKKPDEIMVHLAPPPPLPPPPPPPPPPKIPPPPQQKMVEMKPQDKTPPKPTPSPAPSAPGPKASGPPSDEGIGGAGGTGGDGIGGTGGSVFGYYASQVGDQVRALLQRDPRTRNARFHVKGHVFFDTTGKITRSTLAASSDDPAVDAAIKEVLAGYQLNAPPQGMPPSVSMNLDGRRPN